MALSRQDAFQLLRPACVELSSVALQFKGKQATIKRVYNALVSVQKILNRADIQAALDEKLAEYTFFPLTHIFNQAQALSSSTIESAIACVIVLVSSGWKSNIAPEMAKQLLILMTLLAGGQAKSTTQEPTDEVKSLSFQCMRAIVEQLSQKVKGRQLLSDVGSKSIIDQLAYLLVEAVTVSTSDEVQLAATQALQSIVAAVSDRMVLASLLPRTVSSLTRALRVSTNARRTKKVLTAYLELLDQMLKSTLADDVVYPNLTNQNDADENVLDEGWLRTTAEQIQLALTQVMRLRSHDGTEVKTALATVCFTILQDCARSLSGSQSLALETLNIIAQLDPSAASASKVKYLLNAQPEASELLQTKIDAWCRSLPTTLQTNEARPKEQLLAQLGAAISMAAQSSQISPEVVRHLADGLVDGLANLQAIESTSKRLGHKAITSSVPLELRMMKERGAFPPVLLGKTNDSSFAGSLQHLLHELKNTGLSNQFASAAMRRLTDAASRDQIVSAWLVLQSLRGGSTIDDLDTFITTDDVSSRDVSRPQLVSDLYTATLPWLIDDSFQDDPESWQMTAIAIESVVLQAQMLDTSYRPELLDSLYPMLALLGSSNAALREHAITGVDLLAKACEYPSTSDMLIDNADYLANSIGMKLNAFDITPQASLVLSTMVHLCGARIIPQVDDLIGSIFSALDNFHGYPDLVESLFKVLRVMVDESKKLPQLAITENMTEPIHTRANVVPSTLNDILEDLKRRKARKRKFQETTDSLNFEVTPRKPWKKAASSPASPKKEDGGIDMEEDDENDRPEDAPATTTDSKEPPLPKSYTLLLRIAQSTAPHLASPSPSVRQTLLQLLDEVAPLLAHHENSFLPLINSIWPAIVPRLLAYTPQSGNEGAGMETAYNACAAADAITSLCKGAGNFMSSRIEEVAPALTKLFTLMQGTPGKRSEKSGASDRGMTSSSDTLSLGPPIHASGDATSKQVDTRSTRAQVHASLIRLFSTILEYVRLSNDTGDQIFELLLPFAHSMTREGSEGEPSGSRVLDQALQKHNADALWLYRQRMIRKPEMAEARSQPSRIEIITSA